MKQGTKRFLPVVFFIAYCSLHSTAQNFAKLEHPLTHAAEYLEIADLNWDGQKEIMMIVRTESGLSKLQVYQYDPTLSQVREYSLNALDSPMIRCRDMNNNGILEIIISGSLEGEAYVEILEYSGNFSLQPLQTQIPQLFNPFQIIDLNQDGRLDLFGKGASSQGSINQLYLNTEAGFEKCTDCTFDFTGSPIATIDVNNDGFLDLITNNEANLELIKNISQTDTLRMNITEQFTGSNLEFGDISEDGFDEILISKVINGVNIIDVLTPDSASFVSNGEVELESLPEKMRLGDFTNDGSLDLISKENDDLKLYSLTSLASPEMTYLTSDIVVDKFTIGDIDADLDLDIVLTGIVNDENVIWLIRNNNSINYAPANPDQLFAIRRGGSVELRWSSGADDTTPANSLTYELHVYDDSGNTMVPVNTYDYRHVSSYGAQLHAQSYILNDLPEGQYTWIVQSIDNSFSGPRCYGYLDCLALFEMGGSSNELSYTLCPGDTIEVTLPTGDTTDWYSMNDGFLENTDVLSYVASKNDTIYANYYIDERITATYVVYINVSESYELDLADFNGCSGDRITYSIDDEFTEASWQFLVSGELYQDSLIDIQATVSDTLVVSVTNTLGCITSDTVVIEVSPIPDIDAGSDITIDIHESVELIATGGVTYEWSPTTRLSDPSSDTTIADPFETTTYTVLGYNESGCSDTDEVTVIVNTPDPPGGSPDIDDPVEENPGSGENAVFVPNLFSPNGDGNNDSFTVYAKNIASATLKVYNSAGQEVFTGLITTNGGVGWDGSYNGTPSSQGTYIWSLSGRYNDGTSIEETGPPRGTVTLIR